MPSPAPATNRLSYPQKFWTGGVNSLINPADIPPNQVAWAVNTINRGGIIQTRPGFRLASSVLGRNLQGFCVFKPINSLSRLVIAVDGKIYWAEWPGLVFKELTGITFKPDAPIIEMCSCLQSVTRNPDNSLRIIEPIRQLIISDGVNKAVAWDGTTTKILDATGPTYETPVGLWMVWTSSRLWISNGSYVRVSDIGNPLSFYEDQFLATKSFFELPDSVTGMIETANERGLLVFTKSTTTVFKSFVRDRKSWGTTPDFQKLVFPGIGCVGGRTACNQYGLTYWYSRLGLVSLDAAMNTDHTSKLLAIDPQMTRSKRTLSPDMSRACAISFENLLFVSVPSGSKYNEHTWVLDQSPMEGLAEGTAWAGIWTGVRPVQWGKGRVGGKDRNYFASYDYSEAHDTKIHVWESVQDDHKDAGGAITCQVQMPVIASPRTMRFKYAEFEVVELLGDVSLTVFVCGMRGPWMKIGEFQLQAEEGSIGSVDQVILSDTSILRAFKPQSRTMRTEEFSSQNMKCTPEATGVMPGIDKGFALLFEWKGRMGIRDVRMVVDDVADSDRGKCSPSEKGQINIVYETGEGMSV